MRTRTVCAFLLSATLAAACRPSSTPPAANPTSSGDSAHVESAKSEKQEHHPDSPAALGVLAEMLGGVGDRPPLPSGLVPIGDCAPGGATAAQELSAQAEASVPLKPGLTMAYAWTRSPREEYECLIQIQSVDTDGVNATLSCDVPERPGPFLRRVCRSDLRSARLLHTVFGTHTAIGASGEELPETIVGATAFSLSSAAFAELKRTGSTPHHYVELNQNGQLDKDGVGDLHVEGRDTMQIIVNDRPIDVPVIKARGQLTWWIRGHRLETSDTAVILDDDRFPLLIDQKSSAETAGSHIRFSKITYPNPTNKGSGLSGGGLLPFGGGSLEEGLVDNKSVDVYGIYFDFNSDRIRKESDPVLREIGDIMRRHPDWRLTINGHTDSIGGNSEANLDLSRRRSDSVRKALVTRFGIAADRLVTGGFGASSPKDTNDTPEGRARNRRVELTRR